jgi:peptidoglycan hydrolase CwlO-like protein
MSQSKTSELEDYVRRIGEHINSIYLKIAEIDKKIIDLEEQMASIKSSLVNNSKSISDLSENTVQNLEFDEFVGRLTESLREFLPPSIPDAAEEE